MVTVSITFLSKLKRIRSMDKYDASMITVIRKSTVLAMISILTNTLGPIGFILCRWFTLYYGMSPFVQIRLFIMSLDMFMNFVIVLLNYAIFHSLYFSLCGCLERNLCIEFITDTDHHSNSAGHQRNNTITLTSRNGTITARIEPYHSPSIYTNGGRSSSMQRIDSPIGIQAFPPMKRSSNVSITADDIKEVKDRLTGLHRMEHSRNLSRTLTHGHCNVDTALEVIMETRDEQSHTFLEWNAADPVSPKTRRNRQRDASRSLSFCVTPLSTNNASVLSDHLRIMESIQEQEHEDSATELRMVYASGMESE